MSWIPIIRRRYSLLVKFSIHRLETCDSAKSAITCFTLDFFKYPVSCNLNFLKKLEYCVNWKTHPCRCIVQSLFNCKPFNEVALMCNISTSLLKKTYSHWLVVQQNLSPYWSLNSSGNHVQKRLFAASCLNPLERIWEVPNCLPLDPKTASTSPEWTVIETSLRMIPVLMFPITLWRHEPGSTWNLRK